MLAHNWPNVETIPMPNVVLTFPCNKPRKVRGTDVKLGQPLYAIYNTEAGLYFIWAYTNHAMADYIAWRVLPGDPTDIAANWRRAVDQLTPTNRGFKPRRDDDVITKAGNVV